MFAYHVSFVQFLNVMLMVCQKNSFLSRKVSAQGQQISSFKVMRVSFRRNFRPRIMVCATTDEKEKSNDLTGKENLDEEASSNNAPSISSSSPFVGAKISSRIAARSTTSRARARYHRFPCPQALLR